MPLAIASTVGTVREENQDRVVVLRFVDVQRREFLLVAVCDGMGGMLDGAKCAANTMATFFASFIEDDQSTAIFTRLERSVLKANKALFDKYRGRGGSTISAVVIDSASNISTLNIGDSRIYSFTEDVLSQCTVDDTIAGQMANRDNAYSGRSELLQYVGVGPDIESHLTKTKIDANKPVTLVITSDGVHYLPLDVMQAILRNAPDQAQAVKRLIDLAVWSGGHDNASVAVISCSDMFIDPIDEDIALIWDPFGEVQVGIERDFKKSVSKYSLNDESVQVKVEQTKRRNSKSKSAPKKKGSSEYKVKDETGEPAPQLQMNFPKKGGAEND